eukprot:TRINITY_DN658_c0_g1_i2.p1 TRINITY_DN658_c0_g1~~TRINITY_DN658_c0_g1_i2.p1  ORF type:complete len:161 (-),score=78.11 TRINITY_DN658_c0_g1_i2:339-821(-)
MDNRIETNESFKNQNGQLDRLIEQNEQLKGLLEKIIEIKERNSNNKDNNKGSGSNDKKEDEEKDYEKGKRICEVIINQTSTASSVAALIGGFAITGYMQIALEDTSSTLALTIRTLMACSFLIEMYVIYACIQFAYAANRKDTREELIHFHATGDTATHI